jgi:hypothetical protein
MSQHVVETCPEGVGSWLPLTEYAVRSGVSLSTIRRKIKTKSITYRLDHGRYLIYLEAPNGAAKSSPAPVIAEDAPALRANPGRETVKEDLNLPLFERTIKMISNAFEHTLKEKDERILLLEKRARELEDRLSELRTLVRVLEEKFEVRY